MRRYGSKKASRPYERIHRRCSLCDSFHETPIKARRALEKRCAKREIVQETI
jgi:hypothetical protein